MKTNALFVLLVTLFIACDQDYNSIGSDIIGCKGFVSDSAQFPLIAYTHKVNPVQTNGLSSNLLGAFKDPEYGLMTANVVSQMIPQTYAPSFGTDPQIESVTLTLPYFSTATELKDDGETLYELDSLFGDSPIKLSVYQSTYYLRETDPDSNFDEGQIYYSNSMETINFDNFRGELLYYDGNFFPSNEEIQVEEEDEDTGEMEITERYTPRLQVELLNTNQFWEKLLFDKEGSADLSNQNNFVNYFRGLYFKTEAINGTGNQFLINFNDTEAQITVKYSYESTVTDNERAESEYVLNFNTNRLSTYESDTDFTEGNPLTGDQNLYLKGGQGSMAVIDLFEGPDENGDGKPDSYLDDFLTNKGKWLINEATLTFYEDASKVYTADDYHAYNRLFVYDVKNEVTLKDYAYDLTTNTTDPLYSKIVHLGQRTESAGTYKYKIRITEYIKNILINDSTNTKIGLVLSTNVNNTLNAILLNSEDENVTTLPEGAVLSPKGTILHGSNSSVPQNLRVKLDIYYTEPKN